jgi:hypothetical protein
MFADVVKTSRDHVFHTTPCASVVALVFAVEIASVGATGVDVSAVLVAITTCTLTGVRDVGPDVSHR